MFIKNFKNKIYFFFLGGGGAILWDNVVLMIRKEFYF
jgi:hypothetical protein